MSEKISLFVPGRICLFGEHSDWAGLMRIINSDIVPGLAIVTGIEQGIYAEIEKSDKFIMRNESNELKNTWVDFECPMQAEKLRETAAGGGYFSYVAGVASYINENYNVGGLKITIQKMTLPIKSGLSSSAAICVLVTRAFNLIYKLNLNTMGEMAAAFKGEQRTSSRCGRLDQACAYGTVPVCMTFDGEDISVKRMVVKKPLHWVFVHLKSKKDTIRILSDLNKCYPFADNELDKKVHKALGSDNKKIVNQAIDYIRHGDIKALGELMTEAQTNFDENVAPASPVELEAPKLHHVLNDITVKSLTYGGKGVGSQGDGTAQFLAKDAECQKKLINHFDMVGLPAYPFTIKPCHRVHKAVIPVAGFGTKLYPSTRSIKNEFMPLLDTDGLVKPVILILLEQLYDSGIDEVCLIVGGEEDVEMYRKYFREPLPEEHQNNLSIKMREYENKILNIGKMISFCIQKEKKGFGHAVFQSRDFCGDDPVLLLVGDTVYRSHTKKTCSMQLIEAYEYLNLPLVSMQKTNVENVVYYGTLSGTWEDEAETIMKVSKFVEKPSVEYAEDFLATTCKNNEKSYFSTFGQYIITPEVFTALGENISFGWSLEKNGGIGLTESMADLIQKCGIFGVALDGEMFDTGSLGTYRDAIRGFSGL